MNNRIRHLLQYLNQDIYEKETVIGLAFLSAIAGESIFLLGRPGVAKSLIARRLKYVFAEGTSFEYLMNRFSTPDEIFGPVSISKLKEEDKYERLTDSYLPDAEVVFLDEIWKAGPSIQNALLTIINEKVYRNGKQEIAVPMRLLLAASNELPEAGQGLEALWDRFLIRYVVEGIQNQENFFEMLTKPLELYVDNVPANLKISSKEYNAWQEEIPHINLPLEVLQCITSIRKTLAELQSENSESDYYISDRRWRKIVQMLRTSALLNERKSVNLQDCFLIAHCIWNQPQSQFKVEEVVVKAINKQANSVQTELQQIEKEIEDFKAEIKTSLTTTINNQVLEPSITQHDKHQYFRVENIPHPFIEVNDYRGLQVGKKPLAIKLWDADFQLYGHYAVCGASADNTLIVNTQSQKLVMTARTVSRKVMQPPNEEMKEVWRGKIAGLLKQQEQVLAGIPNPSKTENAVENQHLFVKQNLNQLQSDERKRIAQQLKLLELDLKELMVRYSL
ncbi:MAG: AAA family ATPase [Chitinophagales bacterium]